MRTPNHLKVFALAQAALFAICTFTGFSSTQAFAEEEAQAKRPHMDLAFCIDTTGSMQGEIDMVKSKVKTLVAKISSGHPAPIVRVGLVAYRDRGDEYITKVFPFTTDIDGMVKDISGLEANGGGDGPESVNEALHVAVHDLKWSADKHTAKLLFLIGDAGPHFYPGDFNWQQESKQAIANGVQINTIGCAGLESYAPADGVDVFKGIAKLADGKFETLAYRQEVAGAGGKRETIISSGGVSYKVKSPSAGAWKEGVAELESKGALEKVATKASPTSPLSTVRSMMMGSYAAASPAPMGASMSGSRDDNNLDEVLFSAARARAKQVLNVDYGK